MDIERYSDKVNKKARFGRESLLGSGVLKLENGYFPPELVQGRLTLSSIQFMIPML